MHKIIENSERILLINPPIEDFTAYNLWAAPLGLLRVIGTLRDFGKNVKYLDLLDGDVGDLGAEKPKYKSDGRHSYWRREIPKPLELSFVKRKFHRFGASDETILNRLREIEKPDVILITTGMTYWYKTVIRTADILREFFKDVPIFVGGVSANLIPEKFEQNGFIVQKGKFSKEVSYHSFYKELLDLSFFPANLIEGCPLKCSYCASPIFYKKVAFQSLVDQVETIKLWHEATGKKDISFYDDALLLKKGRILNNFLKELSALDLSYHVPNGLHLKEIDQPLSDVLFNSNFPQLRFGFETIKEGYDNKSSIAGLKRAAAILHKSGFTPDRIGVYLLAGMPGQTVKDVIQTIKIVVESGARPYLSEFSPVPGTSLYNEHIKDSCLDFQNEPLYQNNTLSSYRSKEFNVDIITNLRKQLSEIYRKQDIKV